MFLPYSTYFDKVDMDTRAFGLLQFGEVDCTRVGNAI